MRTYFQNLWGIDVEDDPAKASFPTFEEVLGMLDLAEARGETFRGFGNDPHAREARDLRNHLTWLITFILNEKLKGTPKNHHYRLVRSLGKFDLLDSTFFVSLNYDTLIDDAIENVSIENKCQKLPDYAVDFTPAPKRDGKPFPRGSLLLKPHGSLNWRHCPTCNTLSLFSPYNSIDDMPNGPWRFPCSTCHSLELPILIPPTFFKAMSKFFLQQIWKRAEEELTRAGRIVFCGYSFPDADLHIKYLLKRAEVNRSSSAPQVFIVNEYAGKTDEARRTEKERYGRFFRHKSEIIWVNASFEQFASEPAVIDDKRLQQPIAQAAMLNDC